MEPIVLSEDSCVLILGGKKQVSALSALNLVTKIIEKGIYEIHNFPIHVLILEIDNISLSKEYPALKLFATQKIREKTLKEAIHSDNAFINSVAYFLYREELISLTELEGKPISFISLSIRSAVEALGLSRVLEEVGLSKVIEEIGMEELSRQLSDEQLAELNELRNKTNQ